MTRQLQLLGAGAFRVRLDGQGPRQQAAVFFETVALGHADPLPADVELKLSQPLEIDAALFEDPSADELTLRTLADVAASADAALRQRFEQARRALRQRLAAPLALRVDGVEGESFFGLKASASQLLAAELLLPSTLLDPDGPPAPIVARARFESAVAAVWRDAAGAPVARDCKGHIGLEVRADTAGFRARLDLLMPESLPGFALRLPDFPLEKLSFDGLDIAFGSEMPSLGALVSLPWLQAFSFSWTGPAPKLQLRVDGDGKLALDMNPPGSGVLTGPGGSLLEIRDFALSRGSAMSLRATLVAPGGSIALPSRTLDVGPFRLTTGPIGLALAPLAWAAGQAPSLPVTITLAELLVASVDDPSISLPISLALRVEADGTHVRTKLTTLSVRAPYNLGLLDELADAAAGFAGDTVRLIGAIPLPGAALPPGAAAVLARLGELLAAALRWLGGEFAHAGRVAAGIAESAMALLEKLFARLTRATDAVLSHLAIEVRLDAATWALRQVVLTPTGESAKLQHHDAVSALGVDFGYHLSARPALVLDLARPWVGIALQFDDNRPLATLATDLWLERETAPAEQTTTLDPQSGKALEPDSPPVEVPEPGAAAGKLPESKRLVAIEVKRKAGAPDVLVLAAVDRGELKLFQELGPVNAEAIAINGAVSVSAIGESSELKDVDWSTLDLKKVELATLKKRLLNLLPKSDPAGSAGGEFVDKLSQYIEISEATTSLETQSGKLSLRLCLGLLVHLAGEKFATQLTVMVDLRRFTAELSGGDSIGIAWTKGKPFELLKLHGMIEPGDAAPGPPAATGGPRNPETFIAFVLDLAGGRQALRLAPGVRARLTYGEASTAGKGMVFDIEAFAMASDGLTLDAKISPEPVILGGVDVPFRFTSGALRIRASRFLGASLAGSGQLPRALIGEANASIALSLAPGDGGKGIVIDSADARLDKTGDPIVCEATRFRLVLTELGLGFVREQGAYHFYFQLTGSARFAPQSGEATAGLLKHLGELEIQLKKTPLTSDPRVLMRSISFQVKCEPPKRGTFFDIFEFELRGFGFHPSSPAFDGDPAISVSGQVKFAFGDIPSLAIDCHQLWIAAPRGRSPFPRVRFDGLTVGLQLGGMARVEGTAIAVDERLPANLFKPDALPSNVTANGFLAAGRIEIKGWAPMSANMGFLELRDRQGGAPRHAFYFYGQRNKLSEKIPTPIGTLYLREIGFGFGYRYTLASIAQVEQAMTPKETIAILDEVSKYQGGLDQIRAWQPTYDNAGLTLAMRALFTVASSSTSDAYNAKSEKTLPNPLLFDVIAAIRSDLTLFMNVRAWLAVNYADWLEAGEAGALRNNPTARGYLYLSAPRQEFLGRFISDGHGHVGEHPPLPAELVKAIRTSRFSATLYICPGLFQFELGWPYELAMSFGDGTNFQIDCQGGLIHRVEDGGMLLGLAFRATGWAKFSGRVGGDSLGASASAEARFALEAKALSYLSLNSSAGTMLYASLQLNVTVEIAVQVWLRFKVWRFTVSLQAGFSLSLSLAIGVELVLFGDARVGGRAHVAIGVQAFGRSLTLGIGFAFGSDALDDARARVARFMELGLTSSTPSSDPALLPQRQERPAVEASRGDRSVLADRRTEAEALQPAPPPQPAGDADAQPKGPREAGDKIEATHFWALVFPTTRDTTGAPQYVLQLIPRDRTPFEGLATSTSTFYASPKVKRVDEREVNWRIGAGDEGDDAHEMIGLAHVPPVLGLDGAIDPTASPVRPTALHNVVVKDPSTPLQDLLLGDLMTELFLHVDQKGVADAMTEPRSPVPLAGRSALGPDAQVNADRLTRAGRARRALAGAAKQAAEVEERRAAVLGAIVETAERIAAAGADANGRWPAAPEDRLDCRHFGLTFVVTETELDALFPATADDRPRQSRFAIKKRDAATPGEVHLFNPPSRHFERLAPRLERPTARRDASGVLLDWDLEPPWTASASAYDDPEFHLRHYRITRFVRGLKEGDWRHVFVVKPAAPVERVDGAQVFIRPPMQFVDDFSQPDTLPEELRQLIRAPQQPPSDPKAVWKRYVRDDNALEVVYTVVPVDCAGTADEFGTVISFAIPRPRVFAAAPVAPKLDLHYPATPLHGWPVERRNQAEAVAVDAVEGTAAVRAALELTVPAPPDGVCFRLRLRRKKAAPGGLFGDEAMQVARQRPDEVEMNTERRDDEDFLLTPGEDPQPDSLPLRLVLPKEAPFDETARCVRVVALGDGTGSSVVRLFRALGLGDDDDDVTTVRGFLRAESTVADSGVEPSAWQSVAFGLGIRGLAPLRPHSGAPGVPAKSAGPRLASPRAPRVVDATVEAFEAVRAVEFQCLQRADLHVETGQLATLLPRAQAGLGDLIGSTPALDARVDLRRRVATRLRWRACPSRLVLADGQPAPAEFWRLIGGFDLYAVDPDLLPPDVGPETLWQDADRCARSLGRVTMLPASLRGLSPDGFGELGKIEAAHPSDTLRMAAARPPASDAATTPRLAPWFSAAESVPVFARPMLRRSLFAAPDEALIALLFSRGRPARVRVRLEGWPLADHPPGVACLAPEWIASEEGEPISPAWALSNADGITPGALRHLLRHLVVAYSDADEFDAAWQARACTEPGAFDGFGAVVEALDGADAILCSEAVPFAALTALHPVLADALALVAYDDQPQAAPAASVAEAAGRTYRRYEVVPEAAPTPDVDSFSAYLDQTPPARDPFGWGGLRLLGLAAGFRLYDTETGEYVLGQQLLDKVHRSMAGAWGRYAGPALDVDASLGSPFVDLVTRPWGNARLSGFDGGTEAPPDAQTQVVANELIAAVQISLRPVAAGLLTGNGAAGAMPPVHYRTYTLASTDEPPPATISLQLNAEGEWPAFYDLVEVGGPTPGRPVRIEGRGKAPVTVPIGPNPGGRIFVLRVAATAAGGHVAPTLPGFVLGKLERIDRPSALREQHPDVDPFGLFEDLPPADWARVLLPADKPVFRPFERLLFYAERRFGPAPPPRSRDEAADLVRRCIDFWRCFLLHGDASAPAGGSPSPRIAFSLGTLADPGIWREPMAVDGSLSAVLVEAERFGARRRYAVRPFGRFEALAAQVPAVQVAGQLYRYAPPRGLEFGLPHGRSKGTDWDACFADGTLPRTEPVAKPVVLSSRLRTQTRALELIVAHSPDQTLAHANRAMQARVAQQGIGVAFYREFAHPRWASALLPKDDPMAGFGSLSSRVPDDALDLRIGRDNGDEDLRLVRDDVPDAWLGAWVVRARQMPYFFRVHALVHARAGVMVSAPSVATFEEGFSALRLPWQPDLASTAGHVGLHRTGSPAYSVERAAGQLNLTFEVPTVRFIDCMHPEDRMLWFGDQLQWMGSLDPIVHLPDPGTLYRIGLQTRQRSGEIAAWQPELALLPTPPENPGDGVYSVVRSGLMRVLPDPAKGTVPMLRPAQGTSTRDWTLRVSAALTAPAPPDSPPAPVAWPPGWQAVLATLALPPAANPGWWACAPRGAITVRVNKPPVVDGTRDWAGFAERCEALRGRLPLWAATGLPIVADIANWAGDLRALCGGDADDAWAGFPGANGDAIDRAFDDWRAGLPLAIWGDLASVVAGADGSTFAWPGAQGPDAAIRQEVLAALVIGDPAVKPALRSAMQAQFHREVQQPLERGHAGIAPRSLSLAGVSAETADKLVALCHRAPDAAPIGLSYPPLCLTLPATAPPVPDALDAVLAFLEGRPGSGFAIEGLLDWAAQAPPEPITTEWTLPIPATADFITALQALGATGIEPPGTTLPARLVLWLPPTDPELGPVLAALEEGWRDRLRTLAREQLFGVNRWPALQVVRGQELPQDTLFDRKTETP